jgi:hypothetical protein
MSSDRIIPPAPRSSSAPLGKKPSTEADFWAGLFLDLAIRVEWLGQALDAVPKEDASAAAVVRLRSYARALEELRHAVEQVQRHRANDRLKPLFSLEGPLAALLSRLYAWCEEIGEDFERMAVALRNRRPTTIVFSHRAVNASYAEFAKLIAAIRKVEDAHARDRDGATTEQAQHWRRFDEDLEELIWATEWLHMTLARRPGE